MKITEFNGSENEIVEIFQVKTRLCLVIKRRLLDEIYHNGYVQTQKKHYGIDYEKFINRVDTDELTFSDYIGDEYFFGFDSAHAWNDHEPISKTQKFVKNKTKELALEMIKRGI